MGKAAVEAAQDKVNALVASLKELTEKAGALVSDAVDAAYNKGVEVVETIKMRLELELAAAKNALTAAQAAYDATKADEETVTVVLKESEDGDEKTTQDGTVKLSAATACFEDYLACVDSASAADTCVKTQHTCLAAAAA